jgi:outer membrane receptor for monomeric catechols
MSAFAPLAAAKWTSKKGVQGLRRSQSRAQLCEKAMHIGLLRTATAAALLTCFACGTFAAAAGSYRSVPAPGWTNAKHPSVSRLPARRVLSGRPFARSAWYSSYGPHGLPRAEKLPRTTVITRRVLDDMNATALRDALRYVPGVGVR